MSSDPNARKPTTASPTPLRDWMAAQPARSRWIAIVLFTFLIAIGGKAAVQLPYAAVPASHLLFFVLAAGALLGSRPGAVAATLYLLAGALFGALLPTGAGPTPFSGIMAGYLWSLPMVAYLAGWSVERWGMESGPHFAIGVLAGVAAFGALGLAGVMASLGCSPEEAFSRSVGLFVGQQAMQAGLVIAIAASCSSFIHARERK